MDILGATLTKAFVGDVPVASAFEGKKAVGLYFSAHWCPPCRGFTPKLAEFYTKDLAAKGLEIVFVSSDQDQAQFDGYFAEMPWLALPYSDRETKDKLSKKFKVQGIPSFVILDPTDGSIITTDGRSAVMMDPTGDKLPWKPPTFAEAVGDTFLKGDGVVGKEAIAGKTIGLYFSAHWCPPCRGFTPQLAAWYKGLKSELGDKFEIIFCSGDRDEASMKSYHAEQAAAGGDWLCLPFANKDALDSKYEVQGIPAFIIITPEGKVINKNGRGLVPNATAADFPFAPPPISDIESPDGINETPALILFLEGMDPGAQAAVIEAVTPLAAAEAAKDEPEILFFAAKSPGGVSGQIRGMAKLAAPSAKPAIVLMDIPDNGGYYTAEHDSIDGSVVEKMIADWKGKELQRQQLSS